MQTILQKLLIVLTCATSVALAEEDGFRPLFNGKDLTGWVEVNTAPSTWHFNEEGYLVCSGKPIGEIRTEQMLQNFILELEWRHLKPKGNAGIFVWADDITARGQPFHRGIEVQILENAYGDTKGHTTHGDIFPIHGARMSPINGRGGGRAFPVENRSNPSPEWNHYRIECRDGNISLAVNGKVVTQGTNCSPSKGYLCIESEGGIVNYRNARIKELPDTPIAEENIATANRGFRCLYTGVDLSGWQAASGWKSRDWEMIAKADAEPLFTEEEFSGDIGFIVDVKLSEDSGPFQLSVHGKELALSQDHPALEKIGRWNRIEGFLRSGELALEINGEEAGTMTGFSGKGPIGLIPDGPTDWANPYVRKLPPAD
tara:strand:+ start:2728 stop:3843 length:1116 start_codon:yes stop_codon:yes gene_type:complete